MAPQVATLVVHYVVNKLTDSAVEDLLAQTCKHDLYVLDCGSPEPYVNPKANILRLSKSRGLAGSINWAMNLMWDYDYLWHFTNDISCKPETLSALVEMMEKDDSLAAVQPSMPSSHPHLNPRDEGGTNYAAYLEWAAVLVNMNAWEDIGPLDEDFNFFSMDLDWSHRAKEQGWKLGVNYDVPCGHSWRGTHSATKFDISKQGLKEHEHGRRKYGRDDWQQWLKGEMP